MAEANLDTLVGLLPRDLESRLREKLNASGECFSDWLAEQASDFLEAEVSPGVGFDASPVVTWEWDVREDQLELSKNATSVLGLLPGDVIDEPEDGLALFHPDDQDAAKAELARATAQGGAIHLTSRIVRPVDGRIIHVEIHGHVIVSESEQPVRAVGVTVVVTKPEQKDESLLSREEYLRAIVEHTPECIKVVASDGRLLQMNPAGLEMVEAQSSTEIEGSSVFRLIAPEHQEAFRNFNERVCGGESGKLEFDIIGKKGGRLHMETHAAPLTCPDGSTAQLALTRDITARKKAEDGLLRERDLLRVTLASIEDAVITTDANGCVNNLNRGAEKLTGWSFANAEGKPVDSICQFLDEDSRVPIDFTELLKLEDNELSGSTHHVILNADDDVRIPVELRIAQIESRESTPASCVLAFTDISERKSAEVALRESAAHFRNVADNAPAKLWLTDPDGNCSFLSKRWSEITGQSQQDGLKNGWLSAVHPEDVNRVTRIFAEANAKQEAFSFDFRLRGFDGKFHWVIDSGRPRFDGNGNFMGFIGSVFDVHERKQAEEFRAGQALILEMVANEEPLDAILTELVRFVERQVPDSAGAILLADREGETLHHAAALNLPEEFIHLIDGTAVGPDVTPCGIAAYRKDQVIVEDIAADSLRKEFKELAERHSLRACWSHPILSGNGDLLGTLALYFLESRTPEGREADILRETAQFAALVVERPRAQRALRQSEERFRAFTDATTDIVYRVNSDWTEMLHLEGRELFADTSGPNRTWIETYIHPDDRLMVRKAVKEAVAEKGVVELEHRAVRLDGSTRWMLSRAIPILDENNEIIEWFGAAGDITASKEAAETLRRTTQTFATLIEESPLGIYVVDSEFRVAQVSRGSEATFQNIRPLIGRDFGEVMHAIWPHSFAEEAISIFKHTLETGESYTSPGLIEKRKDIGTIESYEWQLIRIKLADGRYGVVCYYFDVTRLQTALADLRKSEERFRMLADNMNQLAWTCEDLGTATWFNQRWLNFTGCDLEEMCEWGWTRVVHPDHLDRVVESVNRSRESGEIWEDTYPLRSKDGDYRWFLSRATPIPDSDNDVIHWFGTNTDVTELRETQQLLHDADRRKDEFLATLAHELRNPLAPIRTGLEVLKMANDNPEILEKVRVTMERQTQQLISLVDDLLNVSRITRGKLELRRATVQLEDILESALEAARSMIDEAGHELTTAFPDHTIYLEADANRLVQIISNLLNNAAKYTDAGGRIRLAVREAGDFVEISVEDSGIGIPADMLDKVFEMFAQIDRPQVKGYSGLGIGLCLVKSLVEMHSGQINVESGGANRGSTFTVRLPILDADSVESTVPAAINEESAESTRESLKILVVDDNEEAATMLSMEVEMLGNEVRLAHDGREAVEVAANFAPDIILMDLGMPNMNGFDSARLIRQKPWGKKLLLVALTGWGQEDDRRKTSEAGFDLHLVKPVEPAVLEEVLQRASDEAER